MKKIGTIEDPWGPPLVGNIWLSIISIIRESYISMKLNSKFKLSSIYCIKSFFYIY